MSARLTRALIIYVVFISVFLMSQQNLWKDTNDPVELKILAQRSIVMPLFVMFIAIISYYISLLFSLF